MSWTLAELRDYVNVCQKKNCDVDISLDSPIPRLALTPSGCIYCEKNYREKYWFSSAACSVTIGEKLIKPAQRAFVPRLFIASYKLIRYLSVILKIPTKKKKIIPDSSQNSTIFSDPSCEVSCKFFVIKLN